MTYCMSDLNALIHEQVVVYSRQNKRRVHMNVATLKSATRHLEAACAMGALVLAGELQAQDFSYTNTNGTITITGYTGPGGDVVIPATIDGLPVTSIGDGALSFINLGSDQSNLTGLSNMTSITIPDGV